MTVFQVPFHQNQPVNGVIGSKILPLFDNDLEPGLGSDQGNKDFIIPPEVYSICIVCIGAGGGGAESGAGGGGGGLRWINDVKVTPGEILTVGVGTAGRGENYLFAGSPAENGGDSLVIRAASGTVIVRAGGGISGAGTRAGGTGSTIGGNIGGGDGGAGALAGFSGNNTRSGGGGGAGGYSGNGGAGSGTGNGSNAATNSGGGGGGCRGFQRSSTGAGGGGVGIFGLGSTGTGGIVPALDGGGGGGVSGSGGDAGGVTDTFESGVDFIYPGGGGLYGGGGGGAPTTGLILNGSNGGPGQVRIIWGPNRAFPSTNTDGLSATQIT